METLYKLKASDLNFNFVEAIKKLFQDEEIIISVTRAKKSKKLTIQYSEKILDALNNVNEGNVKYFTGEEFLELTEKLQQNETY